MANNNWVATSGSWWNISSNWSLGNIPNNTDTAVFNNGSTFNCTINQNVVCSGITISGAYTGNMDATGYGFYLNNSYIDDGTGTRNLGSGIIMNNPVTTLHIGSTVGTITASLSDLYFNYSGHILDIDKVVLFKSLTVANSGTVNNTGTQGLYLSSSSGTLLTLENNSSFTGGYLNLNSNSILGISGLSLGSNYTFSASSSRFSNGGNHKIIFPNFIMAGNGQIDVGGNAGTLEFNGFDVGTSQWFSRSSTTCTFNYNSGTYKLGEFSFGLAGSTHNLGSSTINCTSLTGATYGGAAIYNMSTSTINCSGNFVLAAANVINPGTSIVNITNTSSITSATKSLYDININTTVSGNMATFVDSPNVLGRFTVTRGSTNLSSLNWSGYGDILFDGTGSHTVGSGITMMGDGTLRFGNSQANMITQGCYVKCNGNTSLTIGNKTINRLGLASGKTYTWSAGVPTTKISTYTAGDWNGSTWVSSSPGSKYYVNSPASVSLSNANIKDCDNSAGTLITANDGTNTTRGNNVNIKFMGTISINPITGTESGGTGINISDTGNSFGGSFTSTLDGVSCTSPTILTTKTGSCVSPLHVPGIVDFVILTSDGETQTLAGGWTYTSNEPPYIPPTISGALTEMRFYNPFLHQQYVNKNRRVLQAVKRYIG